MHGAAPGRYIPAVHGAAAAPIRPEAGRCRGGDRGERGWSKGAGVYLIHPIGLKFRNLPHTVHYTFFRSFAAILGRIFLYGVYLYCMHEKSL